MKLQVQLSEVARRGAFPHISTVLLVIPASRLVFGRWTGVLALGMRVASRLVSEVLTGVCSLWTLAQSCLISVRNSGKGGVLVAVIMGAATSTTLSAGSFNLFKGGCCASGCKNHAYVWW